MKIIICLDDALGMLFNSRRQSRDRCVTDDIIKLTKGKGLYISPFSKKLFDEREGEYELCEDMLSSAQSGEYCFVENMPIKPYIARVEEIVVYRWNRLYPSDVKLDIDIEKEGFKKLSSEDFEGYSHEKITKEVFGR